MDCRVTRLIIMHKIQHNKIPIFTSPILSGRIIADILENHAGQLSIHPAWFQVWETLTATAHLSVHENECTFGINLGYG